MMNSTSFQGWLPPSSNSFNMSVDPFGNVSLPSTLVQNTRSSRPPSPPWGQTVQNKYVTVNFGYKLQPLGVVPASGPFRSGNHVGNVLLCNLIPVFGEQIRSRDLAKHRQMKLRRAKSIQRRKRAATWKSCLFPVLKQRQLKRLQRQPLLKNKKQEVYEKWEKRRIRGEFKRRQQRQMGSSMNLQSSLPLANVSTTFREGLESPFQCPVWSCRRSPRVRYSRRDEFAQKRKKQPSRLSCSSDKSRSPITIGESQHT